VEGKWVEKNSAISFCRGTLKLFIYIYICVIFFRVFGWIILMQKINIQKLELKLCPNPNLIFSI
jgi:hypothetical protein